MSLQTKRSTPLWKAKYWNLKSLLEIGNWLFENSEFDFALKYYQLASDLLLRSKCDNVAATQVQRKELDSVKARLHCNGAMQ